jgi:hypothetical protein
MTTHRENFYRKHNIPLNTSLSIKEIAILARVPVKLLEEIAKRGAGAWSSNLGSVRLQGSFKKNPDTSAFPRSARLSQSQWKFARIYSFLDKGKTYYTADADLAKEYGV